MASTVASPESAGAAKSLNFEPHIEDDEEDDLFEIDLEAVNSISPTHYSWESYFTATGNIALMANCLLPVADISNAIPTASSAYKEALSLAEQLFVCSVSKRISSAFPGAFGIHHQKEMRT